MRIEFQNGNQSVAAELNRDQDRIVLKFLNKTLSGKILQWTPPRFVIETTEGATRGCFYSGKDFIDVHLPQGNFRLRYPARASRSSGAHAAGDLTSPMPGKVVQVFVREGDKVKKGDLLMILEAMKMEHRILSPQDGVIKKIHFKEGARVVQDIELLEMAS